MASDLCVYPGCGLDFAPGPNERPADGRNGAGRTETRVGPMHFRCEKKLRAEAWERALDQITLTRHVSVTVERPGALTDTRA